MYVQDYSILFIHTFVLVGILRTCGKDWHHHIISRKVGVSVHETSLSSTISYLSAGTKSGNWVIMCLCIKGIDYSSFYYFDIWFWNSSDSEVVYVFPLISNYFIDSVDWYTFSLKWFVIRHTMVFFCLVQNPLMPLIQIMRQNRYHKSIIRNFVNQLVYLV